MWTGKHTWPVISTVVSKLKGFKVTSSHVHCKSGNNISETAQDSDIVTIDEWQTYRIISDDCELSSASCTNADLLKRNFFLHLCSSWQDFNWNSTCTLHGPSVIAGPLVGCIFMRGYRNNCCKIWSIINTIILQYQLLIKILTLSLV